MTLLSENYSHRSLVYLDVCLSGMNRRNRRAVVFDVTLEDTAAFFLGFPSRETAGPKVYHQSDYCVQKRVYKIKSLKDSCVNQLLRLSGEHIKSIWPHIPFGCKELIKEYVRELLSGRLHMSVQYSITECYACSPKYHSGSKGTCQVCRNTKTEVRILREHGHLIGVKYHPTKGLQKLAED